MSFSDHKITAFTHRIADLPDQPNLPADELKARFDSSPEELRVAHNAVCDDAARLEARVEGIVVETFGDTIDKEMLSDELAAELDAKAEAADVTTVTDALDSRLSSAESTITTHTSQIAQKCQMYVGSYVGDDVDGRNISLGFRPKAVLIFNDTCLTYFNGTALGGLALDGKPIGYLGTIGAEITASGFRVYQKYDAKLNTSSTTYYYLAFR